MKNANSDEYPNSVPHDVEVSVRVTTYNHAGYIRDAIEGALNQDTDFPYEIVIGEDESDDGTREICIEYAQKHPDKIRLFLRREEDKIYINGRKTGRYNSIETRKACRGRYIALLEGDEYWIDRRKLQMQRDYLKANQDCKMCATRALVKCEGEGTGADRISLMSGTGGQLTCADFIYGRLVNLCSMMFRSEDYGKPIEWAQGYYWGDKSAMLNSTAGGGYCYVIPSVMSIYRVHGKGLWSSGARDAAKTNGLMSEYFKDFHQAFPTVEVAAVRSAIKFYKFCSLRMSGNVAVTFCYFIRNALPILRFRSAAKLR